MHTPETHIPYDQVKFNNQTYAVRFLLVNRHVGIELHHQTILSLVINEDINSIFPTGKLVIDNTGNALEQMPAACFAQADSNKLWTYAFNTDNRDVFIIDIFPTTPSFFGGKDEQVFPEDKYRMYYEFVVYDEEEEQGEDDTKKKIFYLKDIREQILTESNIQWSSYEAFSIVPELSGKHINFSHGSNKDRSPYTGAAIKHFIQKVFSDSTGDIITNKFDDWDHGATTIFYSTSPNHSGYDSLEYLLDHHISQSDRDNCILGLEKTSMGAGHWFLRPLSKFFENAVTDGAVGNFTEDLFHVASTSMRAPFTQLNSDEPEDSSNIPQKGYAQIARSSIIQEFTGLQNFNFLNAPNGVGLSELVSTITHGYNFSQHQFELDCFETYIGEIKKKFKNLYVRHFNLFEGSPEPIFPITDEKLTNRIVNHVYSEGSTSIDRVKGGVNRVLSKALAYTPGIDFATDGWPYRQPGRFIVLLDSTIQPESSFEKIFSGEWFMTRVVHNFNFDKQPGGTYFQQIACIKPHSYAPLVPED